MKLDEYLSQLPEERKTPIRKLTQVIHKNLPKGFQEMVGPNGISYVVPHSLYPDGYHCNPADPLPFLSIASQKNFIALYHMGVYANKNLLEWFQEKWPQHSESKLDMGKSCIRLKKPEQIPYELIGELVSKMSPQQWIRMYEQVIKK